MPSEYGKIRFESSDSIEKGVGFVDRNTPVVITPDVRKWITSAALSGHSIASMMQYMVSTGWPEALAAEAIHMTLSTDEPSSVSVVEIPATSAVPEPDTVMRPSVVSAEDRDVRVLLTVNAPRVVVFGGLLSSQECRELIAFARPKLNRSKTVDHETGGDQIHSSRTSEGMFFNRGENELVSRIEARIAALIQWPVEKGEGLQVLRYGPGQEYRPHYDYFIPSAPGTPQILKRGGQRVASVVMYLNTPKAGGGTLFPDIGVEVAPQRGNAVFFSYDRPDPSTKTLHGGSPVFAGEKWVATKWLREQIHE